MAFNAGAGYYFKKNNGGSFLQLVSNNSGHKLYYRKDLIATSNNYYIGFKYARLWNHFFNPNPYDNSKQHLFYAGPLASVTFPLSQKKGIPAYTSSDNQFVILPNSFKPSSENNYDLNIGFQMGYDCAGIGLKNIMLKAEIKSSVGYLYNWSYEYAYGNNIKDLMTIRNRNLLTSLEVIYFLK